MVISTRKLIRMERKWQRKAAIGRKLRVTFPKKEVDGSIAACSTSSPVTNKGHFVLYTVDQKRSSFPIAFLNNYIFRELLRMAEEEFGLSSGDGHITMPCEADCMDYSLSVIQRRSTTTEVENALLLSITNYNNRYFGSSTCVGVDPWKINNQHDFVVSCF